MEKLHYNLKSTASNVVFAILLMFQVHFDILLNDLKTFRSVHMHGQRAFANSNKFNHLVMLINK